jgi:Phage integrase family
MEIRSSGSGFARPAVDLVEFLAYGGFRKNEAAHIIWADCDFDRGKIVLKGDPLTGLKGRHAGESREIPMIPDMRTLLERIKTERQNETPASRVMRVSECQKSIDRAVKILGIGRITHHDLRHLFATRCIESGVDIPTVSRWLGHRDGGAMAMKVYGHLRDEHSTKMAQKVTFLDGLGAAGDELPQGPLPGNEAKKKSPAQAKAAYSYPWWASKDATEIFWGQANEPVQIVALPKYHASAKTAMGREVFENELAEPQALLDELLERVGAAAVEKLKARIAANRDSRKPD